jgi:ABC-type glycerol-3-phosphate transport system permease component
MVAFLALMPVLVLLIAIRNRFSRGLTMGAVKG